MVHYLLVDGYNVIHANAALAAVAADSLEAARKKLCDALCEFRALSRYRIVVVFDAHLVAGGIGSVETHRTIKVVFTREAETADHYIERATYKLAAKKTQKITVATSDTMEQLIIMGSGASRISAEDLWTEIETARAETLARYNKTRPIKKNPIEGFLDKETARILDEMRYGEL
ncbi:MAG: NYN domain-containing protein [Clostridiales bacterium]|jgi:predicted RNA-binding protein with PIN domain|nr:NYN domain-containing protein [Clostridiales bacterium]